ncbi:SMC-Scp complex subunit ScpB [Vagococcus fluvialis]|jgi:segregation and condensation protein B|uniref:Segregation and condensation protein B n=1 Tax=Vagococcus fluvialis TaxID=2738 RepID=A0A7X6D8P9_9ENTE|nr:SMC-Scp complex subunit ScpB [Vagococcus fluvialis]MDR2277464.1 SMC-Scp complex subunit ScpB [Vagococcus sp.]OTP29404.1 segregation and condensation protein B [Enterococcus sp. 6C8_DIV0013]MBO0418984.1 SMC-Scp complex subunit ScpB [Vagococcus fluvialis]MBO0428183.1 SMC-Scp complex subunit ScpB [Vagococcus fluvialis]MBO0436934.1 SMC-Scp complex subunit ScpB [Vagococcus fluvialis]
MKVSSKIEALLFVAGNEGLTLTEISHMINLSTASLYNEITELKKNYEESEESSLTILEVGDRFMLSTKKEYASLLKQYAQSSINQSLSQAALECLSIVAYKQPITRAEIEELRGVQSSGSVQKLVTRRLIEEKSRVDGPGRAILYGTTAYFLDYFGLKTVDELPPVEQLDENAEKEIPNDLFFDRFKEQFEKLEEEQEEI